MSQTEYEQIDELMSTQTNDKLIGEQTTDNNTKKRKSDEIDNNDSLKELCKCPVCFDYNDIKCKTCENGHMICSFCYKNILRNIYSAHVCPICRCAFTKYTQTMISQIYENVNFDVDCIYDECKAKIPIKDYWTHKETCPYKPTICYFENCKYIHANNIIDVANHYEHVHNHDNVSLVNNKINFNTLDTLSSSYKFIMDDLNFVVPLSEHNCNILVFTRSDTMELEHQYIPQQPNVDVKVFIFIVIPLNKMTPIPALDIAIKTGDSVISSTKMIDQSTNLTLSLKQIQSEIMLSGKASYSLEIKTMQFEEN